jgi:hypothetical protein
MSLPHTIVDHNSQGACMFRRILAVNAVVLAIVITFAWGSILFLTEIAQWREDAEAEPEELNDLHW